MSIVAPPLEAQAADPQPAGKPLVQRLLGSPDRFDLGGQIRGRFENVTGIGFAPGADDAYYLHRLRFHLGVRLTDWFRVFAEAQDVRAPGYDSRPVPANAADSLDLRQAHITIGSANGIAVRAGRQTLAFGDERLVGASDWTNTGRTFDAMRLLFNGPGLRLDAFASSVVRTVHSRFDETQFDDKLYGVYVSKSSLPRGTSVEPYLFVRTNRTARAESGAAGDLVEYTFGARVVSQFSEQIEADGEMAFQTGRSASDSIRAWAGHWRARFHAGHGASAPQLIGEYNYASGDAAAGDGRRGTFDQLYPTNHSKYGIVDRIGWQNIHDVMGGVDWRPNTHWKINVDYHSFWLANRRDALYTQSGGVFVRNPSASSAHIGTELDFQALYKFSDTIQFGGGAGHLFAGRYLEESSRGSGASFSYLMWSYAF